MIWLIIGAVLYAFFLSATDEFKKPFYGGYEGDVICQLLARRGGMSVTQFMQFSLVSKRLHEDMESLLCKKRLEKFVTDHYLSNDCVTYSPTQLSAAILRIKPANAHYLRSFEYAYFNDQNKIKIKKYACTQLSRALLFFVGKYPCLDFCIDLTTHARHDDTSSGFYWDPITKYCSKTRFLVSCNGIYVPTGWFAQKLPGLHKKIMQKEQSFAKKDFVYFHRDDDSAGYARKDFAIDLVKAGILTNKESKTLSKFVPRGAYAEWNNINNKRHREKLLSLLFCYGSEEALLPVVKCYIGRKYLYRLVNRWPHHYISLYDGKTSYYYRDKVTHLVDPKFIDHTYKNATIEHVMEIKKIAEADMDTVQKPFTKTIEIWQKPILFLKKERMTHIKIEPYHLCYDSLTSRISLFDTAHCSHISTFPVNADIDIETIKVFDKGKSITYRSKGS